MIIRDFWQKILQAKVARCVSLGKEQPKMLHLNLHFRRQQHGKAE